MSTKLRETDRLFRVGTLWWVQVDDDEFIIWNDRTQDYDDWRPRRSRFYLETVYGPLVEVAA